MNDLAIKLNYIKCNFGLSWGRVVVKEIDAGTKMVCYFSYQ